jgi:hypothetical protein
MLEQGESAKELLVASSAFNEVIVCFSFCPLGGLYKDNLAQNFLSP